jgi:hypothetical protein
VLAHYFSSCFSAWTVTVGGQQGDPSGATTRYAAPTITGVTIAGVVSTLGELHLCWPTFDFLSVSAVLGGDTFTVDGTSFGSAATSDLRMRYNSQVCHRICSGYLRCAFLLVLPTLICFHFLLDSG